MGIKRLVILIAAVVLAVTAVTSAGAQTAGSVPAANSSGDIQGVLTKVAQLMDHREYPAALELFDTLDKSLVQNSDLQLLRASLLNSAGKPAAARAIASGIASREPANVDALLVLAAAAAMEEKDREQRRLLEKVVKLDPHNLKALSDLGYIALRAQSLRTAAGHFEKALAADGNYREALVGRAIVYRYADLPKQSEQLLNKAIRLYADWAIPFHERGRLYKGAGFTEDALLDFDRAKKLEPRNYWISVDRASTLLELNRKDEALAELNHAITLSPDSFLGYIFRAGIREELGDFKGAEQDYIVVTTLKPDYYFAAEALGILRMRNRQYAQARDAFLSAYKQAPKEYRYAMLAAVNWMKAGRPGDPKQFLAQVLRTVPRDSPDWYILRLYHDLSGDSDAVAKASQEKNLDTKSKMLFYLAHYYDARGNTSLANSFFVQVQDMQRAGTIEWKINEMILAERIKNE